MAKVVTIGVVGGGSEAEALNGVIRVVAHAAISTASVRISGVTFEEGGA
jgi:hypothetical protein